MWRSRFFRGGSEGQVSVLVLAALLAVVAGGFVLGATGRGLQAEGEAQRAADLAALAGARAMLDAYPRLFEPAEIDGRPNPRHLTRGAYLRLGREAALAVAERNQAPDARASFPDGDTFAPVRIAVETTRRLEVHDKRVGASAEAHAELAPVTDEGLAIGGGYQGPLAYRQGKPMRPDVAQAFDRMQTAARKDGISLLITSAYRSDAEQAELFARNPDPKWVAPPGKSLHRYATELDLGPPAAYGWLARNAKRFHFLQRYSWEPWHYGYTLNAGSNLTFPDRGGQGGRPGDGEHHSALPSFVPPRYAPILARAAQRWNVSATLLAAQIHAESNFNPFAVSPAGARGISQFMPATAHAYGLRDPHDPVAAINAQAHMMRDLLRRFSSVPLALAAYNAGPARVAACMCIPPIPETRGYVARILGLMGGAGELAGGLAVRLVR
jgi:hypothetical protein